MTTPRAHQFPPPLDGAYEVVDGRVQTRSLEAHVVDHCNLTCAECCSLSPLLPRWAVSPEVFARDLELASRVLSPRVFKLVGGEPLLHPELLTLARLAQASGIAPRLSITTNGLLLERTPDALWEVIDALTISRYPRPALSEAAVDAITARAERFGVALNWKHQARFVIMNRAEPCEDDAETAAIYAQCWLRERCHFIRDGVFYTCTRPPHFQSYLGDDHDFTGDGLRLDALGDDGHAALLDYLQRDRPLEACAWCRGGSAEMTPHRLLSAAELKALRHPDR